MGKSRAKVHSQGCVSLKESKVGFLNPKESENGFCVSLLNSSIQEAASKEPKNRLLSVSIHGLICLKVLANEDT